VVLRNRKGGGEIVSEVEGNTKKLNNRPKKKLSLEVKAEPDSKKLTWENLYNRVCPRKKKQVGGRKIRRPA